MAWIESHQALVQHPKVLQLAKACGWSVDETIGKLHRFWWWCLDYATDGRLDKFDHSTIESVFGVSDSNGSVVQVLIQLRWLDSEPQIRVHDWWDYAGRFLQIRYKRTPKIWKEIKRFYGHSIQRNCSRTVTEQQPTNNHKPNQPNLTNQPNKKIAVSDSEWWERLQQQPRYQHVNFESENRRMNDWLARPENAGRKKSRRFITNWLDKVEVPVVLESQPPDDRFEEVTLPDGRTFMREKLKVCL